MVAPRFVATSLAVADTSTLALLAFAAAPSCAGGIVNWYFAAPSCQSNTSLGALLSLLHPPVPHPAIPAVDHTCQNVSPCYHNSRPRLSLETFRARALVLQPSKHENNGRSCYRKGPHRDVNVRSALPGGVPLPGGAPPPGGVRIVYKIPPYYSLVSSKKCISCPPCGQEMEFLTPHYDVAYSTLF